MKVKDLLNDLTDEQKELLEKDQRKEKYKKLSHFLQTKDFEKICKHFEKKWEALTKKVTDLIQNRNECKAEKSELDKNYQFYNFQKELAEKLWDSEAEQVLKKDLLDNAENTYTHCLNKIEELYDAPVYTQLDLLKQLRIDYLMVWERLRRMTEFYLDTKEIMDNANPYEEQE